MKKIILLLAGMFACSLAYSQVNQILQSPIYYLNNYVGIGTTNPSQLLEIKGSLGSSLFEGYRLTLTRDNNNIIDANSGLGNAQLIFRTGGTNAVMIDKNQNFGIGTTAPSEKLQVEGNILANGEIYSKRLRISLTPGIWPDYVFKPEYDLMSLKEVESFIRTNKHLPDVPSAKVVEQDGLDIGSMDATLLKKVEELTLYLIEVNKKVEKLQEENVALKKALKEQN